MSEEIEAQILVRQLTIVFNKKGHRDRPLTYMHLFIDGDEATVYALERVFEGSNFLENMLMIVPGLREHGINTLRAKMVKRVAYALQKRLAGNVESVKIGAPHIHPNGLPLYPVMILL